MAYGRVSDILGSSLSTALTIWMALAKRSELQFSVSQHGAEKLGWGDSQWEGVLSAALHLLVLPALDMSQSLRGELVGQGTPRRLRAASSMGKYLTSHFATVLV